MKKLLFVAIIPFFFTLQGFTQEKQDLTMTKFFYDMFKTPPSSDQDPESINHYSNVPNSNPIRHQEIDSCLVKFKKGLAAKLENYSSHVYVHSQLEPSRYQITLTSTLKDCPNIKETTFKGNWNYVRNQNNQNILLQDHLKIDAANKHPLEFQSFVYSVLIDYKVGDSQPSKLSGNIVLKIPSKFRIVELTANDLNKEVKVGNSIMKLLELKGNTYKMEVIQEDETVKTLPVNADNLEFSTVTKKGFPLYYYTEFSKSNNLTDDDLAKIQNGFDKNDKRIVKVGTVSGTINKILVYTIEDTITKEVEINLDIKK